MEQQRTIIHMIGNAHIDPVWLWRWQEGVDEALASFRSAADRCDEYPEFVYTRGEAWLYENVARIDPKLFERVRELVANGRWFPTGGQLIQPDANGPTELGWHKQLTRGRDYFKKTFGVETKVGYNVDTFGHPATLPDLLTREGYIGYVFHRPSPSQVELPSQTFRWQGVNGGEVIGFRIVPAYVTRSDDLYGQIMLTLDGADTNLGHAMCFYGVGNHGGGPTKGNIEYILENRFAFDGFELRFSHPQAFFDAVSPIRDRMPVVTKELQRTFPGCYSVMHDIKSEQRRGEILLDQTARVLEAFSSDETRSAQQGEKLATAWDDLLFTQFHDILAGTSVPAAWPSVRAMQGRARISAEEIVLEATRTFARNNLAAVNHQQLALLNANDEAWKGIVEATPFLDFDNWNDRWLSDENGNAIDFQRVQSQAMMLANSVVFPAEVAAKSGTIVLVRDDENPHKNIETDLSASENHLANARVRVETNERGISRIVVDGRDVLGKDGLTLQLRVDNADTWGFHIFEFGEAVSQVLEGGTWVVEESGPLRARLRLETRLGNSQLRWTLSLHRGEPRLHMQLEVTWSEQLTLLQMPIHLAEKPAAWRDGLAGGAVNRTPSSDKTEWPMQTFSRVEVGGKPLAFLTEDAYSVSLSDDLWAWSLLRSPRMAWGGGDPDPYVGRNWFCDQGAHTFEFVLVLDGEMGDAELVATAREYSQKPVVFDRYEGMDRPPWGNNPPRSMWTGAEQRAQQDGRMMHLDMTGPANIEEKPLTAETGATETEPPDVK